VINLESTGQMNMVDSPDFAMSVLESTSQSDLTHFPKKQKSVTYNMLQEVFSEFSRLSIAQGNQKIAYGAGIHLLELAKSGSTNIEESVNTTILRYASTFTNTCDVTFGSTSSDTMYPLPPKPMPAPGNRGRE